MPTGTQLHHARITEKQATSQADAKKLAQGYRDNFVGMRYRQDAPSGQQCTTAEHIVNAHHTATDNRVPDTVQLGIAITEINLQQQTKKLDFQ